MGGADRPVDHRARPAGAATDHVHGVPRGGARHHAAAGAPAGAADDAAFLQRGFASLGRRARCTGSTRGGADQVHGRHAQRPRGRRAQGCAPSVVRRGRLASIDGSGARRLPTARRTNCRGPTPRRRRRCALHRRRLRLWRERGGGAAADLEGRQRITVQEIFQFWLLLQRRGDRVARCQTALAPDEKNRCDRRRAAATAAAPTPSRCWARWAAVTRCSSRCATAPLVRHAGDGRVAPASASSRSR